MNMWEIFQIFITAFEVGLCIWLCDILLYNCKFVREHKVYVLVSILLITAGVIGNRVIVFFSLLIFLLENFYIWIILNLKNKKPRWLSALVIYDYLLMTALLDLTIIFVAVNYIDENLWETLYFAVGGQRILVCVISRIIMLGICLLIKKYKKRLNIQMENYKVVLISMAAVGSLWIWWILKSLVDYVTQAAVRHSFLVIASLIILLGFVVMNLQNVYLQSQADMARMKGELLEQSYRNLFGLYQENKYIYHDFKHHLFFVRDYLKRQEYEEAEGYINQIAEPVEHLSNHVYSGCEMVDLVLNIKKNEAYKKGIDFKVEIAGEVSREIDENSLANILFNLLDNATEACEKMMKKKKWIRVVLQRKGEMYIVKIENSIDNQIISNGEMYRTDKKDKKLHGIGMESVKSSVESYGGDVRWSHTKDIFTVLITFFGMDNI